MTESPKTTPKHKPRKKKPRHKDGVKPELSGPARMMRRIGAVLAILVAVGAVALVVRYKRTGKTAEAYLNESDAAVAGGDRAEGLRLAERAVKAADTPEKRANALLRAADLATPVVSAPSAEPPSAKTLEQLQKSMKLRYEAWTQASTDTKSGLELLAYQRAISKYAAPTQQSWDEVKRFAQSIQQREPDNWRAGAAYAEAQLARWTANADGKVRATDIAGLLARFDLAKVPDPETFGRIALQLLARNGDSQMESDEIRLEVSKLLERWYARPETDVDSRYWRARIRAAAAGPKEVAAANQAVRELRAEIIGAANESTCVQYASDLAAINRELTVGVETRLIDSGVADAIAFLKEAALTRPDAFELKKALAAYLAESGEWTEAATLFQEVAAVHLPQPSAEAFARYRLQSEALYGEAAALLSQLEDGGDPTVLDARVEPLIAKLRSHPTIEPRTMMLRARALAFRGKLPEAAAAALNATTVTTGPEPFLIAGLALLKANEPGAAAVALNTAVKDARLLGAADRLNLTLAMSRVLLSVKRLDEAARILEHTRSQLPDNLELAELTFTVLTAQLAQMRAATNPAAELFETTLRDEIANLPAGDPKTRLQAVFLDVTGRPQRAVNLLATLALTPENVSSWQRVIGRNPDALATFQSWVQRRLTSVAEGPARTLMLATMEAAPEDLESFRRLLAAAAEPMSQQHLTCTKAHLIAGRVAEARKALTAAEAAGLQASLVAQMRVQIEKNARNAAALRTLAAEEGIDPTRSLWRTAMAQLVEDDRDGAEASLAQVCEAWPFFSDAWHARAIIAAQSGALDKAETFIRKALEARPGRLDSLHVFGRLRMSKGDTEAGLASLVESFRLAPSPAALEGLLIQLEQLKGPRVAQAARTRLAREMPENVRNRQALAGLLVRQNLHAEAKTVLDDLIREQPRLTTAIVSRAILDYLLDDVEAAKTRVQARLDADDLGAADWLEIAGFRQRIGDAVGAEEALLQASKCPDADDHRVNVKWAEFLFQQGRYKQAAVLFDRLYAATPTIPYGLRLLDCLLEMRQPELASKVLDQLAVREPAPPLAIQRARIAMLTGDAEASEKRFSEAIAANPKDAHAYTFRGLARLQSDQPARGVEDLREAIHLAPAFVRPRAELWYYHLSRQRLDEAAEPLKIEAENPIANLPVIQLMRGILQLRKGDYTLATDILFEEAIRGTGGTLSMDMLQRALEAGCRFHSALTLTDRLLENAPDSPAYLHNRAWYRILLDQQLDQAVADAAAADQALGTANPIARATHAYALARVGRSADALAILDALPESAANDTLVLLYRYEALRALPDRRQDADAVIAKIIELPEPPPPAFGYYVALADLAWRAEKQDAAALLPLLQDAVLSCRTTTESDVIAANVIAGLGRVQFLAGMDSVVALSNLRQSSQLADGPAPYAFRAEILRARGDKTSAATANAEAQSRLSQQHPQYLRARIAAAQQR